MRHVRILGLCLVAMLAMSATTFVVASPALASCNQECKEQKQKEKQEAKEQKEKEKEEAKAQKTKEKEEAQEKKALETGVGDPWGINNWHAYRACPWEKSKLPFGERLTDCFVGVTLGGKEGGYFEYGHIKVPLSKRVTLQGGFKGEGSEIEVEPELQPGYKTLEAPPLPVDNGLKVITPEIQEIAQWPQALKESYSNALKNGEKAVYATIEMAGSECYEVPGCLDTENLLFEEGVAFRLPLKVKVSGPWLETLGSGPCYIGSDESPIHINLTTEGAGTSGALAFNEEFTIVFLHGSKLVDFKWHIPPASGANGCGGTYESYIDKALDIALEVENGYGYSNPAKTGIVILKGNLHDGAASAVATEAENGNV